MKTSFYENNITIVPIHSSSFTLDINSSTFFIGSCFANNLYKVYDGLYLNSHFAPFGNVYNPKSIGKSLIRLLNNQSVTEDELILVDGIYQHYDFHSTTGNVNKNIFLNNINLKIQEAHIKLLSSDFLIITLGTAFIYEINNEVVNNCHKLPSSSFKRREMDIEEITNSLLEPIEILKSMNKNVKVILTLSPVRHLRDSPIENSYSKSLLRVAINKIQNKTEAYYFPSYEILLDELRDYRWYDTNLTHPNITATNYIINRFIDSFKSKELDDYLEKIKTINKMFNHKIVNKDSESSIKFINKLEIKKNQIKNEYKKLYKLQEI